MPATAPETFSWEALSQLLSAHFEIPDFQLQAKLGAWLTDANRLAGIGSPKTFLAFAIGSLPGTAHWVLSTADAEALMGALLTKESSSLSNIDTDFREGFLHYVGAEMLVFLNQLGFTDSFSPRLLGHQPPSEEDKAFCIDVSVTVLGQTLFSRLVISQELANAWKEAFVRSSRTKEISPSLAQKIDIDIHLEAGRVTLPRLTWSKVVPGDFIILDQCGVIPGLDKGRIMLTAGGVPLFRGMLKKEQIKILEYPLYHEVETSMNHDESEENHETEEFSETDEDLHEESEFGDEDLTDEEVELEEFLEEAQGENHSEEAKIPETQAEAEPVGTAQGPLSALDNIPLNIIIEVGRLKMTLAKLKELQPGHLLELDVKPEQGVDLTINGRCIGRGELLRVGEVLGVRVLELG